MTAVADALQFAIYDKLVSALAVPVYSFVPDNAFGSYVQIGDDTFIDWSDDCGSGFEGTITIHSWTVPEQDNSSFRGPMTCKRLQGEIYSTLHRAELDVVGYQCVGINQEYQDTMQDGDGLSYHGVQRFRVFLYETGLIS